MPLAGSEATACWGASGFNLSRLMEGVGSGPGEAP